MSGRCTNPMCLDIERRYADSVSRERYQERCNDIVFLERQLKEAKDNNEQNMIESDEAIKHLQQQLAEANERIKSYDKNQELTFKELSTKLTNGNAGTWEQLLHKAGLLQSELAQLRKVHHVMIQCGGCGLTTVTDCAQEAGIDIAWITEKEEEALRAEVERLKKEITEWKANYHEK